MRTSGAIVAFLALVVYGDAWAEPPSFSPSQLDRLVGRVAVFSDPLLAQVLAAAGFADEIPAAAQWAGQHRDVSGQDLAGVMRSDDQRFVPSVQALLPFPVLLEQMAADLPWTTELGIAVLAEPPEVLNAIQRQRSKAAALGYLRTDANVIVESASGVITILPRNAAYLFAPSYDAETVFSGRGAGSAATDAVRYGLAVNIGGFRPFGWTAKRWESFGSYFQPWGWGSTGIEWGTRSLIIGGIAWGRTWDNRYDYVHPYPDLRKVVQ